MVHTRNSRSRHSLTSAEPGRQGGAGFGERERGVEWSEGEKWGGQRLKSCGGCEAC